MKSYLDLTVEDQKFKMRVGKEVLDFKRYVDLKLRDIIDTYNYYIDFLESDNETKTKIAKIKKIL